MQIEHDIKVAGETTDLNTQSINDGKAYFTVTITNPTGSAPLNTISVTDPRVTACSKTAAQINAIMATVGKVTPVSATSKNNILEAGESFSYDCLSTTLATAFPDDENIITINSVTADTFKAPVTATAKTGATYSVQKSINIDIKHDIITETDTTDK